MTPRQHGRAAGRRWGAGAAFALQWRDSGAPGTRQSEGPNALGRARNELSPLSPLISGLSPQPAGTDFFNGDNGLRQLSTVVPAVPAKKLREPKADPAESHGAAPGGVTHTPL